MSDSFEKDGCNFFLPTYLLPKGFLYPKSFIQIIEQRLVDLEPWGILEGKLLLLKAEGLKSRYPSINLIPFARRFDNDDVACWISNASEEVVIIHDYSEVNYLFRDKYSNFFEWFKAAIRDTINFNEGHSH